MNNLSSEQSVSRQDTAGAPLPRTTLVVTAWIATLALSNLPLVIARDVLGTDIPWMTPIWLAAAGYGRKPADPCAGATASRRTCSQPIKRRKSSHA